MDVRNSIELVVKKNEKEFFFVAANNADLGDCYSACHEMLAFIAEKIAENVKEKEPKNEEAPKEECQSRCC